MSLWQRPSDRGGQVRNILGIVAVLVVLAGIALIKGRPAPAAPGQAAGTAASAQNAAPAPSLSPTEQYAQALAAGQPMLVFMHSTNCESCLQMMEVVRQVYPEYAGRITLVDVDVYDSANVSLSQKLGLRAIPTLVVFDRSGQSWQSVGVIKPDALRTILRTRALGE